MIGNDKWLEITSKHFLNFSQLLSNSYFPMELKTWVLSVFLRLGVITVVNPMMSGLNSNPGRDFTFYFILYIFTSTYYISFS